MALPANTKSTNTTETVRGEHRFDIDGYCVKHHAGRVLTSETFVVVGLDWAIRYHPAGADVGDEEYVSVFVRLVTPNASARALYDLRLVDRATGLPSSVRRRREPVAFEASKAKKRERGSRMFMTSWRRSSRRPRRLREMPSRRRRTCRVTSARCCCGRRFGQT
ncbi:BTB/POZ and MATH domain-containing protein 1-like [Miscanthus floridulus]|uniref:BTB/POZ and MATH domain-containing protein 1-like n=1 Tax=Miscanthus floridulus TaxID=154761 RepID=UPI0034586057